MSNLNCHSRLLSSYYLGRGGAEAFTVGGVGRGAGRNDGKGDRRVSRCTKLCKMHAKIIAVRSHDSMKWSQQCAQLAGCFMLYISRQQIVPGQGRGVPNKQTVLSSIKCRYGIESVVHKLSSQFESELKVEKHCTATTALTPEPSCRLPTYSSWTGAVCLFHRRGSLSTLNFEQEALSYRILSNWSVHRYISKPC